ncbi:MAG: DUF488 domain-containing protein [bacterium]|nr:DUF488 domain-containing protein [bacterium]
MTVFTIGYEGLSIEAFIALLKQHGIETVVDVRALPLSRKPGFSKKSLANTLNLAGLEYVHMVKLGCPKPVRDHYREDGSWKRYTTGFMKHLKTQDEAVAELSQLATTSNCALLCYEADYNFCHRSMVANAIRDFCGADVQHIQASNTRKANPASLQLAFA